MRVSILCLFLVSVVFVSDASASTTVPGDTIIQLAAAPRILGPTEDFPGMWEYVYDVVGTVDASGRNHAWTNLAFLDGFDADLMVNRWNDAGDRWDGTQADPWNYEPLQRWSANAAGTPMPYMGPIYFDLWPSYWGVTPGTEPFNFSAWHEPKDVHPTRWDTYDIVYDVNPGAVNQAWYTDNPWHAGSEYAHGSSPWPFAHAGYATWGQVSIDPGPDGIEGNADDVYEDQVVSYDSDGIWFQNAGVNFYAITGMLLTFRVVHPNPPGEITWRTNATTGTILGPGSPWTLPGDFDEDGDVDGDDIDLMGDYIRTGVAPTSAEFDLSDDGVTGGPGGFVIDVLDLDYLIRFLVETSAVDLAGNPIFGTEYGDFDLNGEVDYDDEATLLSNFGLGDRWFEGNANRNIDLSIDIVDWQIWNTYVPEPATMSLLALGGLAVLRRRKS